MYDSDEIDQHQDTRIRGLPIRIIDTDFYQPLDVNIDGNLQVRGTVTVNTEGRHNDIIVPGTTLTDAMDIMIDRMLSLETRIAILEGRLGGEEEMVET